MTIPPDGLSCVGFAAEYGATAGVYGDDFAVFQDIGSMGSADDGRDAKGDGDDSRFAGEAGFFGDDGAGPFHVVDEISAGRTDYEDAAVGEVLFQVFFRFGDADFADSRVTADTGTAEEDVTDDLDADHIGRTGFSNGDTCREDDEVAGFDEVVVEGCKDSIAS